MPNALLYKSLKCRINSLAYDPKRSILAGGLSDGTIRAWNLSTGNSDILARYPGEVLCIAYDPRQPEMAAGLSDGTIRLFDLENNNSKVLKGHTGKVTSIAYDPVNEELASGAFDGTIRIWKNGNNRVLERDTVKGEGLSYTPSMDCVVYSREGKYLACCSRGGEIHIWNRDNKEQQVLKNYWAESIAFDVPRGRLFAGTLDGRIYAIDIQSGMEEPVGVFKKHAMPTIITHDTKKERIAIIESDGIYIWDLEIGATQIFNCSTNGIMTVAFDPRNEQIAIGYHDGTICIGDIASNIEINCFKVSASD